ncbi:MAG TPA: adenosylcobinamide-GDP ribazoletransferase [Acidimicrobiales bacterium]|nr:adenosylcobinamide-GDP ribazoletransferase [Acidimicrobiales bacterium]
MRRALAFLSPFGGAVAPAPSALVWFGPVGAAIGLAVGGIWWSAGRAWPAAEAAAVAIAADVALTGYLHLDGLADAADGLLPPLDPDRRLAAMADPAVGAFGIVTVAVVLLLRYGAFASAHAVPLVVGALWCGSRTAMAVTARAVPYARPGGLASKFLASSDAEADPDLGVGGVTGGAGEAGGAGSEKQRHPRGRPPSVLVPFIVGAPIAVALAIWGRGTRGLVSLAAEMLAVAGTVMLARRRVGGFTGDVLGAAGVLGETAGLLVLAARW